PYIGNNSIKMRENLFLSEIQKSKSLTHTIILHGGASKSRRKTHRRYVSYSNLSAAISQFHTIPSTFRQIHRLMLLRVVSDDRR
ncbi:MAG: hypothetical protein Q8755_03315, partial [Candidatus Phytoplasma australasiaticum]|nr:hypothetical protein [Candidatus Phytoplasma australasiaticum]